MITKKGRAAQLNGIYTELLTNPSLAFYESGGEVARIDFDSDGIVFENNAIHFKDHEAFVRFSSNPDTAIIFGRGVALFELEIGTELVIDPLPLVKGSLLKINELTIE